MSLLLIPGTSLPEWAEDLRAERGFVVDDLPITDYHAATALLSNSLIQIARRSLFQLRYAIDQRLEGADDGQDEKEWSIIGNALHCAILEPFAFESRYMRLPDFGDMRSSTKRAYRDAWLAENLRGRCGLTEPQWRMVHDMREAFFRNRKLRTLLEHGRPEVTAVARDPGTGLPRRARADWFNDRLGIALDLKTALDASKQAWKRAAGTRGYHIQDSWYRDVFRLAGCEIQEFAFVVIEKRPPYDLGCYTLEPDYLLAGEKIVQAQLVRIMRAAQRNEWPGYTDGVEMLSLSKYVIDDAEAEYEALTP